MVRDCVCINVCVCVYSHSSSVSAQDRASASRAYPTRHLHSAQIVAQIELLRWWRLIALQQDAIQRSVEQSWSISAPIAPSVAAVHQLLIVVHFVYLLLSWLLSFGLCLRSLMLRVPFWDASYLDSIYVRCDACKEQRIIHLTNFRVSGLSVLLAQAAKASIFLMSRVSQSRSLIHISKAKSAVQRVNFSVAEFSNFSCLALPLDLSANRV